MTKTTGTKWEVREVDGVFDICAIHGVTPPENPWVFDGEDVDVLRANYALAARSPELLSAKAALETECGELRLRLDRLEDAMQEFVDKCDVGLAKSRLTYNKFKSLLEEPLHQRKTQVKLELEQLAEEANCSNWDGYDSDPISINAILYTRLFTEHLLQGQPLPKFCPEPDGGISMDWIKPNGAILSMSVNPTTGNIAFASRLSVEDLGGHAGVVPFNGIDYPTEAMDLLGEFNRFD